MINLKFFTEKEIFDVYKEQYYNNSENPNYDKLEFLFFKIKMKSLEEIMEKLDLSFIEFKKKGNMYARVRFEKKDPKNTEELFYVDAGVNWILASKETLEKLVVQEDYYTIGETKTEKHNTEDFQLDKDKKQNIIKLLKSNYSDEVLKRYFKQYPGENVNQCSILTFINLMKSELKLDKINKNGDFKKYKKIQKIFGKFVNLFYNWNHYSSKPMVIDGVDPNDYFIYFSNITTSWKDSDAMELFEKLSVENKRMILSDILKESKEDIYVNFLVNDINNAEKYALYSPSVELRNLIEKYSKTKEEKVNYDNLVKYPYSASVTLTRNMLKKILPELSPNSLKTMFHTMAPYCGEQLNILSYDSNYVFTFSSENSLLDNKLWMNFIIKKIEEIGARMDREENGNNIYINNLYKEIIPEILLFNNVLRELSLKNDLEKVNKEESFLKKKKI